MNVAEHVQFGARLFPDSPAILFEGRTVTYREIDAASSRLGAALANLGANTGDRIAIFLPNIPEFVTVYLAAQKLVPRPAWIE